MNYLFKRLLWSIPTLFAVVIIGFILSLYGPGDPVDTLMGIGSNEDPLKPHSQYLEKQKKDWEEKLGLNLPLFYLTIQSSSLPDTLYKYGNRSEKSIIRSLCLKSGNPEFVSEYRIRLKLIKSGFRDDIKSMNDSVRLNSLDQIARINKNILVLENNKDPKRILPLLEVIEDNVQNDNYTNCAYHLGRTIFWIHSTEIKGKSNAFLPTIQFHKKNRFHQWLFGDGVYSKGIISGDFGISYTSKEPIRNHIYINLFWSILFSGVGILFAYLISIPIGIRQAIHNNSIWEKVTTIILFALYSIPVFFLGTLLQTYLANHQYLHIFEPTGIKPTRGFDPDSNLFDRIWQTLPYMVLPIICFTYSSIAFLTKLTKSTILETLNQPYIVTAKAKGLPFNKVIYKHALRNALIPLITVFANVFPLLVGGSVIIESIFTIPGMGTDMFTSYFSHNIPVIISIFTLTGVFTITGFFISDILYVIVDPRVRK